MSTEVRTSAEHALRLLGSEAALVLHGGGNTSVKTSAIDVTGEAVDVIHVKGSGWDLASIAARASHRCAWPGYGPCSASIGSATGR